MKTLRLSIAAIPLVAFAVTSPVLSKAQTIQVSKDNRTIAITATDTVIAMADTATVHIGFIAYGPDKDAAYAAGSSVSNGIVKALTGAGVPNDAIESENQSVSPVQEYQVDKLTPAEKAQRKFQVTQSWTVRTNASDAAKVLDLAVKAGANQSGQIDWSLKDGNAPQAEAAAKALQRARSVAGQMAAGMNVRLGVLVYASNEIQAEPIRPIMKDRFSGGGLAAVAAPPLAINPRQIEKSATVYAVFAIE
ncbi:MAG: SIMPL domain-containing protein [Edaphobacter sp.]